MTQKYNDNNKSKLNEYSNDKVKLMSKLKYKNQENSYKNKILMSGLEEAILKNEKGSEIHNETPIREFPLHDL